MRTHLSLAGAAALVVLVACLAGAAAPDKAVQLRNRGIAELENEEPAVAEATFLELTKLASDDPLGWGNLAIARLRQQKFDAALAAADRALEASPGDPRLLAIRAEIGQWSGDSEAALADFRAAATAAPNDQELQYSFYRQATIMSGEAPEAAAREALERLARLKPENLVVLLTLGQSARAAGDRAQATAAFLRVNDLIWQEPRAERLLQRVLDGLEENKLDEIRVPAQQLENVLKITPMYRESLRELSTGIQGIPLAALADEPPVESFGKAVDVRFSASLVSSDPVRDLAVGDFDGDEVPDTAFLSAGDAEDAAAATTLDVRLSAGGGKSLSLAAPGIERLLTADLDNDGRLDLFGYGPGGARFWKSDAAAGLSDATEALGLGGASGTAAVAIDFDIEGDLDLFTAGGGAELFRNALAGPLEAVGAQSLPGELPSGSRDAVASDLDGDGDLDLLLAHPEGLTWLDNLRQGRFAERAGLGPAAAADVRRVASADLDNDGLPDLVGVGKGAHLWRNAGGKFEDFPMGRPLATSAELTAVVAFDADNDGRLDLALGGPGGLAVAAQKTPGKLSFLPVDKFTDGVSALAAADLDRDGDLDLLAGGPAGVYRLENRGGNANRWLSVRLRGLDKGNSKNNLLGLGATLEVRAGSAYQFREVTGDVTHFGLGSLQTPDLLRVVWTNGVPQNRLQPETNQWVVEEQVLKGSCPFLYAWDGDGFAFTTDLLWGAPAGLPAGEGKWIGSDPQELVKIDVIEPLDGRYEIRITEELWEAAFFDYTRLWIVDHPSETELASSLKIVPGRSLGEEVFASRALRAPAAAWDATGADVTARVAARDEIYADGWSASRYQGVPTEPWTFTFDLGEAPAAPVRLHLDGWIFPTDASLNLAIDQRSDIPLFPPRLEVETDEGWRPLLKNMGFPAGKTKTMVVDTPALPDGARRLRIVSSQWLSWDRIAWTTDTADDAPVIRAKLAPTVADLRYRGFSRLVRRAPNAPHSFDYARTDTESPWLPFPGRYTRYGDVAELLLEADDRSVILGAGDEMAITFVASELPAVRQGWKRTVFLESHGWDKDADRNTFAPDQVEPLPFRAMAAYGEPFPDTPQHRQYIETWLTRIVLPERLPGTSVSAP